MIQKLLFVLYTVVALQSCRLGASGIWKNGNIGTEKMTELKELNDKLFKAISDNNPSSLKAMMSETAIKNGGDLENFTAQVNTSLKLGNYKVIDDYYIQNTTTGTVGAIPCINGENSYTINYTALDREMFVSLLLTDDPDNRVLVLTIYGKYGNVWKLEIVKVGQYDLFKKNGPAYYKLARSSYDKKYLVDAYLDISLSERLLRPANDYFVFQDEGEINALSAKIKSDLNASFTLPITLAKINSKPKIFRIYPEMGDEGFCPMVQYLTTLNLKDTIALKAENQLIQKEVGNLFPGIDKEKKYIFFWAFNQIPDGQKLVEHYGFIDHLKK